MMTETDLTELERLQGEIEANNFSDPVRHTDLDAEFHGRMYFRHHNRHALDIWWKHREILHAISRRHPVTLARRVAVLSEHRELLGALRAHDEDRAAAIVARHVEGSGRHLLEQMRVASRRSPTASAA